MAGAKLVHHVGAVDFHRARADIEFPRNRLVAAALGQPVEHFALPRRERRDAVPRFDHAAAGGAELFGFLADTGETAGEPLRIERQGEIIERPGLDRLDNAVRARLHVHRNQRQPDAQSPEPVKDHAHPALFRSVTGDDDAFARRVNRQLRQIAIDLAMVAQGKSHTRQFGALAAARIDEVEGGFACHARMTATDP